MLVLYTAVSARADEGYRFFYNFAPGASFIEEERTRQESGGKLISQFNRTIEYQVLQRPGARTNTVTARIASLSNKGRKIDYYEGVIFQANISAKGDIGGYSFSGGLPRHGLLIQAAGPANRSNIYWMPRFPDTPMSIGDTFTHSVSTGNPGMSASAEVVYKLVAVQGHLAEFKLQRSGSLASGSVGGIQNTVGRAVFDMQKGMWSSIDEQGEGKATLPGGVSAIYKQSIHKEVHSQPCHYIIHAGAPTARNCEPLDMDDASLTPCGMVVIIPYVRIGTQGSCPAIEGQYMTEEVQSIPVGPPDVQCPVQTRHTGSGCRIGSGGYLTRCQDTFAICGGMGAFPSEATCTDRFRQQYFIGPQTGPGRRLISENHLEFRIARSNTHLSTEGEIVHSQGCLPEFHHEFDPHIQFPPSSATSP